MVGPLDILKSEPEDMNPALLLAWRLRYREMQGQPPD